MVVCLSWLLGGPVDAFTYVGLVLVVLRMPLPYRIIAIDLMICIDFGIQSYPVLIGLYLSSMISYLYFERYEANS